MGPARARFVALVCLTALVTVGDGRTPDERGDASSPVPSTSTSTTSTTAPPPRSFTLVATGDVLLHAPLWRQAESDAAATGGSGFDFGPLLAGVQPLTSTADAAICHLETPLAPWGGPYSSYPTFSVPPEIGPTLEGLGYDACSTASNHTFDMGASGVDRTLDVLDGVGIEHAGSARTSQEAADTTMLDANGVPVALLSYTYGFNGISAPDGEAWRSNPIDVGRILVDAAAAKDRGAEVVAVALHWGDEYQHEPNRQQLALAPQLLASPDVDVILGHHAHVVQPLEAIDGEWVVYGMGNMIANQGSLGDDKAEGLLIRFTFTEGDGGWQVTDAAYETLLTTGPGPTRLLAVGPALGDPATPPALGDRLVEARDRTAAIVTSRGALDAGLHPVVP